MEWMEQPCEIETLTNTEGVSRILAMDENGTPDLRSVTSEAARETLNWFSVTGVEIHGNDFNEIIKNIVSLKEKHWEKGMFNNKRVVFHSRDIRKKVGAFNPRYIDYDQFIIDISEFLSTIPAKIYTSHIDKLKHTRKYYTPYSPYNLCLEFIFERFCFELRRSDEQGIILLESRGKKEDKDLLAKVKSLLSYGNNYHKPDEFSNVKGVYFNPKRTKDKTKSYWQLEIADLFAYPIHNFAKSGTRDLSFEAIEEKIYGYPYFKGRGIKYFP